MTRRKSGRRERPILFSAPMVRVILADKKTQTRRVLKVPSWASADSLEIENGVATVEARDDESHDARGHLLCPYGAPGDDVWVRETWACLDSKARPGCRLAYRADTIDGERVRVDAPWRPSIHMPRWASRLTLRVTSVRVERLHTITEDDARAEGIVDTPDRVGAHLGVYGRAPSHRTGFGAFAALWREINGAASWDANPLVWRVEFWRVPRDC